MTELSAATAEDQELAILKQRADVLGIPYNGNIGLETLRNRVRDHQTKLESATKAEPELKTAPKTKAQVEQELRDQVKREGLVLLRCRIANLNPQKRDLEGELITVANRFLGTVSKFIPFGEAGESYHIPKVLYDELRDRKFQQVISKKDAQGKEQLSRRMVPEYSIEILPQLTAEELQELAVKQAAAERLGA